MEFKGEIQVEASREAVYEKIRDARFFVSCIDGVRDLEEVDAVYVATEGAAYNWGIFFGPDGREIGRVAKRSILSPGSRERS